MRLLTFDFRVRLQVMSVAEPDYKSEAYRLAELIKQMSV